MSDQRLLYLLFLLVLLVGGLPASSIAQPPDRCPVLDLSDPGQRSFILDHACFFIAAPTEAADSTMAPPLPPKNVEWQPANGRPLVFENTNNVYWIRLYLKNGSTLRDLWYLKLNYPQLDEVTFWSTAEDAETPLVTGDSQPYFSRVVDYRYFLLPLKLEGNETAIVTIRVRSSGAINIPLSLESPDEALANSNHLTLSQGVFYGALLIFGLFNVLMYFGTRMVSYLFNSFYLISLGMFLFAMGGFASRYFWPESPEFANKFIPGIMAICLLSMPLFARSFLEIRGGSALNRFLLGMIILGGLLFVQVLFMPYSISLPVNSSVGVLFMAVLTGVGGIRWHQGYLPAKWYVLACSSLFIGALTYALAVFDFLPAFLPTELLLRPVVGQVSIGAQVLLLNFALVRHWQVINQRLFDTEHQARNRLEIEVERRTAELKEANRQLMSLSLDDALTGLRNRRHLDNHLPELCRESRRTGKPLSVAILDADHFKQLNDRWGHDFGDECLKYIAGKLDEHTKRPRDTAVRFGGEEFALLLPETDAKGAQDLCNRVLKAIEATPLKAPDNEWITITLSAGIATLKPGEPEKNLFRRADEALYEAKASGRNQSSVSV